MTRRSALREAAVVVRALATAAAAGGLLQLIGVPAGMLIGAIAGVSALALSGVRVPRYPRLKQAVQILVGTAVGATLGRDSLHLLGAVAVQVLVSVLLLLVVGVLCGIWLVWRTDLDLITALPATAPGGMVEMVLVSETLGSGGPIVAAIHLLRVLAVLAALPIVLALIT